MDHASFLENEVSPRWLRLNHNQVLILDVREAEAFFGRKGHIGGSTLVPMNHLNQIVGAWPRGARIVTVCQSGRLSLFAAATLRRMGFNNATSLNGGLRAWRRAGYPVKKYEL